MPTPNPARDATTDAGRHWLEQLEQAVRAKVREGEKTTPTTDRKQGRR